MGLADKRHLYAGRQLQPVRLRPPLRAASPLLQTLERPMRKSLSILFFLALFLAGYAAKTVISEVEFNLSIFYVDKCLDQLNKPSIEQKTACYGSAKEHLPYQIISALNFQPSFWKNTQERCVGTKGTKLYEYFECGWWNEFEL